jgi:hypothetical protein
MDPNKSPDVGSFQRSPDGHFLQSSSASRRTAGAFGVFILSQRRMSTARAKIELGIVEQRQLDSSAHVCHVRVARCLPASGRPFSCEPLTVSK